MNDAKVNFIPFHAINEFMLPEYRQEVLQKVLANLDQLPGGQKGAINAEIKRHVTVPGFRNSSIAPLPLKVRGSINAFEKSPLFTAKILSGWAELNSELRSQVYEMLKDRDWELLPAEADRTKLPGFLTKWPDAENYDVLNQAFNERYPENNVPENDVRLMVVWLSGRLPVDMDDKESRE
jgi:hypothetical protein